jgi:hypothetical protein
MRESLDPNSGPAFFTEAYLTSFDHDNLAANYTADPRLSTSIGTPSTYSFNVSSGATFIIVVNEVDSGGGIGSNYTFISGACSTCICPVSLDRTGDNFLTAGGSGTIQVTADPGCSGAATSTGGFAPHISTGWHGNGMVGFNVAPNDGARRTATINIANKVFNVRQSAKFADVIRAMCLPVHSEGFSGRNYSRMREDSQGIHSTVRRIGFARTDVCVHHQGRGPAQSSTSRLPAIQTYPSNPFTHSLIRWLSGGLRPDAIRPTRRSTVPGPPSPESRWLHSSSGRWVCRHPPPPPM